MILYVRLLQELVIVVIIQFKNQMKQASMKSVTEQMHQTALLDVIMQPALACLLHVLEKNARQMSNALRYMEQVSNA